MLGTRTARELARTTRTLLEATRTTRASGATRTAIKDGTATLNDARVGRSRTRRRGRRRRRSLVHRTRTSLRHHHTARRLTGTSRLRRLNRMSMRASVRVCGRSRRGRNHGSSGDRCSGRSRGNRLCRRNRLGRRFHSGRGCCRRGHCFHRLFHHGRRNHGRRRGNRLRCGSNRLGCHLGGLFRYRCFLGSGRRHNHHGLFRHRSLHGHSRGRYHHHRASRRAGYRRRTSNNRGRRRARGNGRRSRLMHDRWRRAGLRNNLARLRPGRRRGGYNRRSLRYGRTSRRLRSRNCHGGPLRRMRTGSLFLFLLLGKNGLQNIAGLGDMREIDLGSDRLTRPATTGGRSAMRRALKVHPHLLCFVSFQ